MDNKRPLIAHLCILMACVFWGLMSPIGKIAMQNGIDNIDLVYFRACGGAVLFWLTSLYLQGLNDRYDDFIGNKYKGKVLIIDVDELDYKTRPDDFALITEKIDAVFPISITHPTKQQQ